jgi:hypothetical protein
MMMSIKRVTQDNILSQSSSTASESNRAHPNRFVTSAPLPVVLYATPCHNGGIELFMSIGLGPIAVQCIETIGE